MYDYRCEECVHNGQCMPIMNMPMMNIPMINMPMHEGNDEDLKIMYPKVYIKIYPMVKHHFDMMVAKYGRMYCPSKDEMDHMCKDISDKYKKHHKDDDDDDDCDDGGMREEGSRFSGGGLIGDLARILIIGNLIGGRNYYGY